jgi:hypothetical protein
VQQRALILALSIGILSILIFPVSGETYVCETHKNPVYLKNTIEGGKIIYICQDESTGTIEVMLDSQQAGKLTLEIPRSVADPRKDDCRDDRFLVMEHRYVSGGDPWVDARYSEKSTNDARTLTITFDAFSPYLTISSSKGLMNKTSENCKDIPNNASNRGKVNGKNDNSSNSKNDVKQCKNGLVSVQRPTGSNICVRPDTAKILYERWGDKFTVQKIDTKCDDPWDNNARAYQLADEYIQNHPDYDNLSADDRFKLQLSVFKKFIEEKGIKVLDIVLKQNAVAPDTCNECSCNTGGHAWQFTVTGKDLVKIKELGFESVKQDS